ncbi:hypothetical protein [Aquimarina longa]|uniref:hypothetical protein n=1 Tax=Aquimarina longa TaxID=1080221 RepID=UPI000ADB2719|nr:hypothetical protein [Aquimarina longa]
MSLPLEKTKEQTNNKKLRIICWLVAIASLALVSSHNFFSTNSKETIAREKAYKELISQRNSVYKTLKAEFIKENNLNTSKNRELMMEYIKIQDQASTKYKSLKKIREEVKVFHFKNMNVFLYQVSIFIILFILSILFKYLTLQLEYKSLRRTYSFVSFVFIFISLYYLVWVFYIKSDLPYLAHIAAISIIAFSIAIVTHSTMYWFYNKTYIISIYKSNIKKLTRHIGIDVKEKYIKEEDRKDYFVDTIDVIDSLD